MKVLRKEFVMAFTSNNDGASKYRGIFAKVLNMEKKQILARVIGI